MSTHTHTPLFILSAIEKEPISVNKLNLHDIRVAFDDAIVKVSHVRPIMHLSLL